jgi:hypothetical protein
VKQVGGWFLGLLVVAAMIGGGWFALRRVKKTEAATITILDSGRSPTDRALWRGVRFALNEFRSRAGHYRIDLVEDPMGLRTAGIGSSESILQLGVQQPRVFLISAFDTLRATPLDCFRITPNFDQQGRAGAAWAKKAKASRVALLWDQASLRSNAIATAFESECRSLGMSVEGPFDADRAPLDRVLAGRPDAVFYSGEQSPYGSAFQLFSSLRSKGFGGTLVMGEADPAVSFLATRPDLVDGTYLVSPFAPAPPELAARMGSIPGPHVTAGYYAMKAALESIDRADSMDPDDLRRIAAKLPYFDAWGRAALRKCALYVARNGRYEFVELLD